MPRKQITITIDPDVLTALDTRGEERSTVISRDLERYYDACTQARKRLKELLSPGEIALILDTTNGTLFSEPLSIRLLWASVSDAISLEGLDKKWKVDGETLVAKVKGLDPFLTIALVDACERWWHRIGRGEQPEPVAALSQEN
jgi:hypothetical protein